jgi:hypothetical protein
VLVEVRLYLSEFRVVPLLVPVNLVVNVVPSIDVAITKLYRLSLPFHHAMSTLQILLVVPKSARIHEPIPGLDHLVLRLLSITFDGGEPASLPFATTPLIGRLVVQLDVKGEALLVYSNGSALLSRSTVK